jgi:hypothetical protein
MARNCIVLVLLNWGFENSEIFENEEMMVSGSTNRITRSVPSFYTSCAASNCPLDRTLGTATFHFLNNGVYTSHGLRTVHLSRCSAAYARRG